ncbi:AAC_HP2_G0015030.mRNA.1.CDS.1 [Saccharomyces cerevisiae]|nr:AAC_HP2_G0015030.mRNA.1.CDS.1 [Saccharomyces cerevisiae]CAI6479431.1 AAC_HP2_G0015030.mRNA.1.CDS.1 [Saccharomyces cerevisiae]
MTQPLIYAYRMCFVIDKYHSIFMCANYLNVYLERSTMVFSFLTVMPGDFIKCLFLRFFVKFKLRFPNGLLNIFQKMLFNMLVQVTHELLRMRICSITNFFRVLVRLV